MEEIYGALLLHKSGQAITESNLKKVMEATGKPVDEAKVKILVESLRDVDIDKELEQATITAPSVSVEKVEEEKKEEVKPEEAAEGLSSLFG